MPVGGPPTGIVRSVCSVLGSTREIVWSSRFATHSDPEPNAIAPGRAPPRPAPRHGSSAVSIAATEFGATRTARRRAASELDVPAAIAAASSSAPPAAISSTVRAAGAARARRRASDGAPVAGVSSAGS